METPKINSENSLLNNSLSGLVAGLGMRTPVAMSSMKTGGGFAGNPRGHMSQPNLPTGQRSGGMSPVGTPNTNRTLAGFEAPTPTQPVRGNASGHSSSYKPGDYGSIPSDSTSAFSSNTTASSSLKTSNALSGRQGSGGRSAPPTAAAAIDPTALKFLDSFALNNTNGRGASSPMVSAGKPPPSASSSQPVLQRAAPTSTRLGTSPPASHRPPAPALSSSARTAFADITKDSFFAGSPMGRGMGGGPSNPMTGSASTHSSAKNLEGLECSLGSRAHSLPSSQENSNSGAMLFGTGASHEQPLKHTAPVADPDPFGSFVSVSVDPMPTSGPVQNDADCFSDFVGAFDNKAPTPSSVGVPAADSPLDIFDSLSNPPPTRAPPPPPQTDSAADSLFNLDDIAGPATSAPTSGKAAAPRHQDYATKAPVDSLFDFPADTPTSSSNPPATTSAATGDLFSTHDAPLSTQPSPLDPFAAIPVDASIPVDAGPPDLDSFFGALPGGGNPPSTSSPLEDLFGPAPPAPQPARSESVDDLFGQMNIGPSKPAPPRAPDGFAAGLSALYGGPGGGGAAPAPLVVESEVSWDLGDGAPVVAADEEGEAGEPEVRAQLRRERLGRGEARG
mmetsp:Transcript_30337/g.66273  ORF Transcript_30337/g.66273 Transcript_30337/m.66273 type:complete len:618 (-) Transcript_30337:2-1855(-)